jgi:hypothetical protein
MIHEERRALVEVILYESKRETIGVFRLFIYCRITFTAELFNYTTIKTIK